jgi:type IV pilus assembly protein PilA
MENLILVLLALLTLALLAVPIHFVVAWVRAWQGKRQPPAWAGAALWLLAAYLIVAIALPGFIKFGGKPKQSEAKTNLGGIFTAQVAYFGEHNTYAGGPSAFAAMNWTPGGTGLYSYFCGDEVIPNEVGARVEQRPGGDWPYPVKPASSDTGFTCLALGNMDHDPALDVWTIDDAKQLVNRPSDDTERVLPWKAIVVAGLFALVIVAAIVDREKGRLPKQQPPTAGTA